MMLTKDEILKRLREHPAYRAALKSVGKEESQRISRYVEGFLGEFADKFSGIAAQVQSDPKGAREAAERLNRVIRERTGVVNVEPAPSGSSAG